MIPRSHDSTDGFHPPVQPVDPLRRRIAIAAITAVTIAGAAIIWLLTGYIDRRIEYDGADEAVLIICLTMILVSLVTLPIALYLYTIGRKIRLAGRFPPPGMAVIRDTPVITGAPARRRGLILMILALLLLVASAYLFAYAWTIYRL